MKKEGYVAIGHLTGDIANQHPPQFFTTVGSSTNTVIKSEFSELLAYELEQIQEMLLNKNRKYGNAALEPVRIFSKANALEQLKVRIDDKLSRLANQQEDEDEDVINDLIGYLILYKMKKRNG